MIIFNANRCYTIPGVKPSLSRMSCDIEDLMLAETWLLHLQF